MLPPPALSPSAHPFSRSGKKKLMLAMEEEKFPPPRPAVAASTTNSQKGVSGRCIRTTARPVGTSRALTEISVQLRPPNSGTASV
ncbi:hypothetical protein NORO109296_11200 [Nocardiopsis rhodophaea]